MKTLNTEIKKIPMLVAGDSMHSTTWYFQDAGEKIKVWSMTDNAGDKLRTAPKFLDKPAARIEWRNLVAAGYRRV